MLCVDDSVAHGCATADEELEAPPPSWSARDGGLSPSRGDDDIVRFPPRHATHNTRAMRQPHETQVTHLPCTVKGGSNSYAHAHVARLQTSVHVLLRPVHGHREHRDASRVERGGE